jgi:copper homeostasis protein
MPNVLLEICIESAEDAVMATAAGADRPELNSALGVGGLTPSLGTLIETRRRIGPDVPVIVMVRPRAGGFCYSDAEFQVMRQDADLAVRHGASGIAFGILTADGRVDVARCRQIVAQVQVHGGAVPEGCVFHRAFDFVPDPLAAVEQLADLGIRRVMTSGQRPTALEGADLIAGLVRQVQGRIEILPAGGIRPSNARELLARTGCTQLHASLREPCPEADNSLQHRAGLALGGQGTSAGAAENGLSATSPRLVAHMVGLLRDRASER